MAGVVDRALALHVALAYLGEGGRFVAVDRDEELLRVEAVHLDEPVVVGNCAVDDQEDVVVVVVDLGALPELLGVLDGKRVKLEDVAEDLVVVGVGLVDVEPEEGVAGEELLDVLAVEVHLFAAAVMDDGAHVRRGAGMQRSLRIVHRVLLDRCSRSDRRRAIP